MKIKTKNLTLITNPNSAKERADAVLYCGVEASIKVAGAVNRDKTFVIDKEGEYELSGVSVINNGSIATISADGVIVGFFGGLKEKMVEATAEKYKDNDVILAPLAFAPGLIGQIEPYVAVLIGYESKEDVEKFLSENKFEVVKRDLDKIKLDQDSLPENTEVYVLNA